MFDRLFDAIATFIDLFIFWVIIDEYERGVCLTLGKRRNWFNKKAVLGPGLHFIWPLAVDNVLVDNVVPDVLALPEQSLTTSDGVDIVIAATVKWSINDIEKITLDVEDADEALEETSCGIIGDVVEASTWEHIHKNGFAANIQKQLTAEVAVWGIEVHKVRMKDKTRAPSLRLW